MTTRTTTITAAQRPFILSFRDSGSSFPLTSEEAQRLLDTQLVVSATRDRVVFADHDTHYTKRRVDLRPATLGGGPAFHIVVR